MAISISYLQLDRIRMYNVHEFESENARELALVRRMLCQCVCACVQCKCIDRDIDRDIDARAHNRHVCMYIYMNKVLIIRSCIRSSRWIEKHVECWWHAYTCPFVRIRDARVRQSSRSWSSGVRYVPQRSLGYRVGIHRSINPCRIARCSWDAPTAMLVQE